MKYLVATFYRIVVLVISFSLASCGGGGSGTPERRVKNVDLEATELQLTYRAAETFQFTWKDAPGARWYNLMESATGDANFVAIASEIQPGKQSFSLTASADQKLQALYKLEACNDKKCASSTLVAVKDILTKLKPAELNMNAEAVKTLRFNWNSSENATKYSLLERENSTSEFYVIQDDIPADQQSFALTVPLHLKANAQYKLRTCEFDRCVESDAVHVQGKLVEAIGYFKATNLDTGDGFGTDVALSADGKTMAISAHKKNLESSSKNGEESSKIKENAGAVYVYVNIDGSWVEQAYLVAENGLAGDRFGFSISLSDDGNILAVGADNREISTIKASEENEDPIQVTGSVYIFNRSDFNGDWVQTKFITPDNTEPARFFGYAVDLSGDGKTLAIGSPGEHLGDRFTETEKGAIYVYKYNDEWQLAEKLTNYEGIANDRLGTSLELDHSGDRLVVGGGKLFFEPATRQTMVVFDKEGESWGLGTMLKVVPNKNNALSVTISADGSLIAARNPQSLFIFEYENGNWDEKLPLPLDFSILDLSYMISSDISVNADGTLIAVGEVMDNSCDVGFGEFLDDCFNSGAVKVFRKVGVNWLNTEYIKPANTSEGDQFGRRLQLSGDGHTLAVASIWEDGVYSPIELGPVSGNAEVTNSGAVYLY